MGSIKVLQIALGRTDADEIKEGLHSASKVSFLDPFKQGGLLVLFV